MSAAWMLRKIPFSFGRKEAALLCVFFSVSCWQMELSWCALLVVMGTPGGPLDRQVLLGRNELDRIGNLRNQECLACRVPTIDNSLTLLKNC